MPYRRNSLEGLAARWVQWAAAVNAIKSPISDNTGIFATLEQPDDVWFLAGCFGGTVRRTCTIPKQTKIFIPILNTWSFDGDSLIDFSKAFGYLKINGKDLDYDIIYTPKPFDVKGVWGNPATESVFNKSVKVYGFWKLVEPLTPGEHEICFGGGDGQGFNLDVIYNITVKPE